MSAVENPPAFPQRQFDSFGHGEDQAGPEGMTLRDYFAAKVLPTCWQQATVMANIGQARDEQVPALAAGLSYMAADAMLAARQEQAA